MIEATDKLNTNIDGLRLFISKEYKDERGSFIRHWEKNTFMQMGLDINFVQDNISVSNKNVIRGLHIQKNNNEQGKLVRALSGGFLDVAVDLRKDSKTYGEYCSVKLTVDNGYLFWIPAGFAHGFKCLYDNSIFFYKCDKPYAPEFETGIIWNDTYCNIDWDLGDEIPIVSKKDTQLFTLEDYTKKYK